MLAIYKRELKSYFTSVVGCLFIAIMTLVNGYFFFTYNLGYGLPYLSYTLSNALLILVFAVPILTMKVLADEKKQKTDQLILTTQVSVGDIVLGKYFALATVYLIVIAITCVYPVILSKYGTIPWSMNYTQVLGMLLYGLALIAIGTFISSLTESQVIAAIISIIVLFAGYMMSSITATISSEETIITKILGSYNLLEPAGTFFNGVIEISNIVYFVSLIVLFLFLTTQSIQKRKWTISKKTFSLGMFSTAFVAIAVVAIIVVNMIVGRICENAEWASIDMTDQKLYQISDDTRELVEGLDEEITIYVLGNKDTDPMLDETLARYESISAKVKVEYKDNTKYPVFYKQYTDTAPSATSLIIVNENNNKFKVVDYQELYESELNYTTYSYETTGYDAEGQITAAIGYITSDNSSVIYKVTGHEEMSLGTAFTDSLEKMNIVVEEVNLLNHTELSPEDCDMLFLISPMRDYSKDEADIVINYLKNGGKVLMTTNYSDTKMTNFNSIADHYSVKILDGIVVENDYSLIYQDPSLILSIGADGCAANLSNYILYGTVQGMYIDKESENYRDTITYTQAASTSELAVCKMNPNNMTTYEMEDGDVKGPFDMVLTLQEEVTDEETGVVRLSQLSILPSFYALSDDANSLVSGANLDVFNNIIKENVEVSESTVVIPVKTLSNEMLVVDKSSANFVGILISIILPLAILFGGVYVWIKRRRL